MTNNLLIDIIGWLGAVLLLTAYFLISSNRIKGASKSYQVLNLIGSGALIVNSAFYRAFPSAFVNVIWIGIALYSLFVFKQQH